MSAQSGASPAPVPTCTIRPDPPLRRAVHLVSTGGYVVVKWCLGPVLYLARQAGWHGTWTKDLDAAINRAVLPLTERADHQLRCDVTPTLRPGDPLPDIPVSLADGPLRSIRSYLDRPMLLVLVRGSWCVYSRLHLADLNGLLPQFEAANVRILGVSSYADKTEWQRLGVRIPVAVDADGALFRALGVQVEQWMETAWGRVLPHESAFLFDASGRLIAADVRRVSSYHTGQTFLSGDEWLRILQTQTASSTPGYKETS